MVDEKKDEEKKDAELQEDEKKDEKEYVTKGEFAKFVAQHQEDGEKIKKITEMLDKLEDEEKDAEMENDEEKEEKKEAEQQEDEKKKEEEKEAVQAKHSKEISRLKDDLKTLKATFAKMGVRKTSSSGSLDKGEDDEALRDLKAKGLL